MLFGEQCKKYTDEDIGSWLLSTEYLDVRDMGEPAARRMHGNSRNCSLHEHVRENALLPDIVQERGDEGMTDQPEDTIDMLGDFDIPIQN